MSVLSATEARPPTHQEPVVSLGQAAWASMFVALYILAASAALVALGLSGVVDFTLESLLAAALGSVTAAAMLGLYVHLFRRNSLTLGDLGFRRPGLRILHLLWQIPGTIIVCMLAQGLTLGLLSLTDFDTATARSTSDPLEDIGGLSTPLIVAVVLVISVLTPLWEEVLFRGAILDGLSGRFRPFAAVVLSAAVFAAVHLVLVGFAYLFLLGIALALLRRFHRNIWAPMLLHAANNALVTLVVLTAI
ncbi:MULTISPECIES: CPBP family intramembrane glutamic endopeptidase [unclassified Arthrobacter]|uniref:CPBP family intramembrane glutamic endopeptidase n=1 Tax=unclassified Arthrobacter TaxID=235627 RepID=UPI001E2C83E6|nr:MULTISPECIES: CPBP family intramembrane glutamic endopeptidase [unclassified Arthrobacter]MCC9145156.1 CPBP family intramembrane metalloprotease [Arthrobacter sp. zg-Y919]MDK1276384.1 CPBP family intramembrane metalloprotease [Arthrobacter sp. zg.Y919]WIB02015.1 CPBP family intramembrane metalloprotease [Arthrobacter sp. zg-Y919]